MSFCQTPYQSLTFQNVNIEKIKFVNTRVVYQNVRAEATKIIDSELLSYLSGRILKER